MLIKEIVEYYYNSKIDTVKVSFRLKEDSEEYIRETEFELSIAEDYGFLLLENKSFESEDFNYQYEEDTDEYIFDEEIPTDEIIDEVELKLFLNEYYSDSSNNLPDPQLF